MRKNLFQFEYFARSAFNQFATGNCLFISKKDCVKIS